MPFLFATKGAAFYFYSCEGDSNIIYTPVMLSLSKHCQRTKSSTSSD